MSTGHYEITIEEETATVSTATELAVVLDVLQGQHDRAVLQQLYPHLAEIMGGPQGLYATLRVLARDDQIYLIDAIGPQLAGVVQTAGALRDNLAALSDPEVEGHLLEALGSQGLTALIRSGEDLAGVLEWVYGSCDQIVLRLLGVRFLQSLFQSGHELSLVLHSLDRERQRELIEMLGWPRVQSLIHSLEDLAHLVRALPAELSIPLLARFTKEELWALVRNADGLLELRRFLDADEMASLDNLLEEHHAE